MDFRKAFDTVNHDRLVEKLSWYGVHDISLLWFKQFLTERYQKTIISGHESSERVVMCGVPQGSIHGPLLFLVYINDLRLSLQHCSVSLYADDTALYFRGDDPHQIENAIQSDLDLIARWLNSNKLFLNVDKTKSMLLSSKQSRFCHVDLQLQVDNKEIEPVSSFKYLGVMLDRFMTFHEHGVYISKKVSQRLHSLSRTRKFMTQDTCLQLYKSLVIPLFDYCDTVYGILPTSDANHLQILQNKACRIILCRNRFAHSEDTHRDLSLPYLR